MTRRSERVVLEIAYDDAREDPPHAWDWHLGVELEAGSVKVLAVMTPEATRAVSDEAPDPYGNRPPRSPYGAESWNEVRREDRLWESGL